MMLIGLLMMIIANSLLGVSKNFSALLFFRAFSGIGAALVFPNCFVLAGQLFPYEQRGKAVGFLTGSGVRGTILSVNSAFMYGGVSLAVATSSLILTGVGFFAIGIVSALMVLGVLIIVTFFLKNPNL